MKQKWKIELIAINKNKRYSLMKITVSKESDVYIINKSAPVHCSRHKDGKVFWTKHKGGRCKPILVYKRENIKDLKGVEFIETHSFNPHLIPNLFKEYNEKKGDCVFEIDCKNYYNSFFQVSIGILKKEGLSKLKEKWKSLDNKTTYVFKKSYLWIAIEIMDIREIIGEKGLEAIKKHFSITAHSE